MKQAQYELLGLLDEIDTVCRKLNIPYFLIEHLLLFAVCKQDMHGYSADIAMRYSDLEKFRKYIELNHSPSREFENRSVNPELAGDYWRYVRSDTLMLDIADTHGYRSFGIAVNIHILRQDSSAADNQLSRSKSLAKEESEQNGIDDAKHSYATFFGFFRRFFTRRSNSFKQHLSSINLESFKEPSSLVIDDTVLRFPVDYWASKKTIILMKHHYRIASRPEIYLSQRYGENWRRIASGLLKEPMSVIASPRIPYRAFLESMAGKNLFQDSKLAWHLRMYQKHYHEEYEVLESNRFVGWDVFYATGVRIRLWKQYMPQKEQILSIWNAGGHDMAMLILEDYRAAQEEYLKKDLAICFDRELWEIYLQWLSENGQEKKRVLLETLLWPEHLEPISETEAEVWLDREKGESEQ